MSTSPIPTEEQFAIIESILSGEQPSELTSTKLNHIGNLPISWAEQQEMLGL